MLQCLYLKRMLLRGKQALTCQSSRLLPAGGGSSARRMLRGCYAVWSPDRDAFCLSKLNSSSKVTFILNKDTEIIKFLGWFIV